MLQRNVSMSRGEMWVRGSGARLLREAAPVDFAALVAEGPSEEDRVQILKDLPRTFPEHPFFAVDVDPGKDGGDTLRCSHPDSLIESLQRVLTALVVRTAGGYTQGLNFIAAVILLAGVSEEDTFWCVVAIVEELFPNFYSDNLSGTKTENAILNALLKQQLPRLAAHLAELSIPLELFSTEWVMTLLAKVLPISMDENPCARVFDLLLGGGTGDRPPQRDPRGVLIRLILVALEHAEERVLATTDMMEVMSLLRELPKELAAELEAFLLQAEHGKMRFSDADVVLLRRQHEVAVEMETCNLSKLRTLSDAFNEADGCGNASFFAPLSYTIFKTTHRSTSHPRQARDKHDDEPSTKRDGVSSGMGMVRSLARSGSRMWSQYLGAKNPLHGCEWQRLSSRKLTRMATALLRSKSFVVLPRPLARC